nr:unnamed protein product [Callosobruchus analis]
MIHLSVNIAEKNLKKALPKKGYLEKGKCLTYHTGKGKSKLTKASRTGVQGKCSSNTCPFKCPNKISEEQQTNITSQYWKPSKKEQRLFVNGCIKQISKIRNTTNTESRRQNTYRYYLKRSDGIDTIVCKTFFLATLGYNKNNDRFLKTVRGRRMLYMLAFEVHKKDSGHEYEITSLEYDSCKKYYEHKTKYRNAREEYLKDSGKPEIENEMIISADLQKVIMLPRAEMFKEIIFMPRIIVFNESFVPVGKAKCTKRLAVLWHEGVAKRNKEEIISAFYTFFRKNRDVEHITIWLDNCSAQNKNWALFSFFVYIVNCSKVNLKQLTIKYFEPGHSYMSADHFHQKVEMSMKRAKNFFDFDDFVSCVAAANGGNTDVISMDIGQFYNWNDLSSKFKLKKSKFYFKELVFAIFQEITLTLNTKQHLNMKSIKFLIFSTTKPLKMALKSLLQEYGTEG